MPIEFEVLSREHKELAKKFKCGNEYIDKFVRTMSYKDKETVTKAAIDTKNNRIVAILTVVSTGVYTERTKKFHKVKDVLSAVEIVNYAVDIRYQKTPYSKIYVEDTLSYQIFNKYIKDLFELSKKEIGIKKVVLYSVDTAVSFYTRCGFHSFKKYMVSAEREALQGCTAMYYNLNY